MDAAAPMDTAVQSQVQASDPKKRIQRVFPVHQHVLHDLERCVTQFALGQEHTFAEFQRIFNTMQMVEVTKSQRTNGRQPAPNETETNYVQLLMQSAARHVQREQFASFEHRLGGLFLVFTLHALQKCSPVALLPVSEDDWSDFEALAQELRAKPHAEGFKALHALWTSGALQHTKSHGLFVVDNESKRDAEQKCAELPTKVPAPTIRQPTPLRALTPELSAEIAHQRGSAAAAVGLLAPRCSPLSRAPSRVPPPMCRLRRPLPSSPRAAEAGRGRRFRRRAAGQPQHPDRSAREVRAELRRVGRLHGAGRGTIVAAAAAGSTVL